MHWSTYNRTFVRTHTHADNWRQAKFTPLSVCVLNNVSCQYIEICMTFFMSSNWRQTNRMPLFWQLIWLLPLFAAINTHTYTLKHCQLLLTIKCKQIDFCQPVQSIRVLILFPSVYEDCIVLMFCESTEFNLVKQVGDMNAARWRHQHGSTQRRRRRAPANAPIPHVPLRIRFNMSLSNSATSHPSPGAQYIFTAQMNQLVRE